MNVQQDIDGLMDGEFSTRTLQQSPSVQGFLTINNFSLNNQMVGDLSLSSIFNSSKNRFDTQISVYTDSSLYPDYFNLLGEQVKILPLMGTLILWVLINLKLVILFIILT